MKRKVFGVAGGASLSSCYAYRKSLFVGPLHRHFEETILLQIKTFIINTKNQKQHFNKIELLEIRFNFYKCNVIITITNLNYIL